MCCEDLSISDDMHVSHTLNGSSVTQWSKYDFGFLPGTATVLTSKIIYHRGGGGLLHNSEQYLADLSWITAKFVTDCCSMSMVSKTLYSHFFSQ